MTDNQHVNILKDISQFKKRFFHKYGVDIHLFIRNVDNRLGLEALETICLTTLHELYPAFVTTKSLEERTRVKEVTIFRQIFFYLAVIKFDYGKTEAARYLKRNHATVIHSIKVCEDYMFIGYDEFNRCLTSVQNKIEEYVANISENNYGEDNSQSDASIIQHERKDLSSYTEV